MCRSRSSGPPDAARQARLTLTCKGGRPNGRGLGCGGGLPGVGRSVLCAGRAQFGPFRRHPGLPDGRRRRAARRRLYRLRLSTLPFTYPPFAAVVLTALAAIPWAAAVALMTVASAARPAGDAVPGPAAARSGEPAGRHRGAAPAVALAVGGGGYLAGSGHGPRSATARWTLLLAAAVLYDLSAARTPAGGRAWRSAWPRAIKLTPAIFVAYLLLTRRYRAAATAAAVFAATVAAGFAVLPASSAWYWAGEFASPGHVSPVQDPENQSLLGVLSRTLHTANVLPLWLPLAAAVAVTGLALAAAAGRRGDDALGFSLCAVTGLLVSPISWTHHWVIAIPALLVAGTAVTAPGEPGRRRRPASARPGSRRSQSSDGPGWRRQLPPQAGSHAPTRCGVQRGLRRHRRARPSAGRRLPVRADSPGCLASRQVQLKVDPRPLDEPSRPRHPRSTGSARLIHKPAHARPPTWDHRHLPHGVYPATLGTHPAFKG